MTDASSPSLAARLLPGPDRLLMVVFLSSLPFTNPQIRGDAVGYYAYIRSAVIDGDIDFENEYRRGDPAFVQACFDEEGRPRPGIISPAGRIRNQWAVGPSLLWSPFFLLAHGLTGLLNLAGAGIAADGYSWPYRWLCAIGTTLYGFLALVMARRLAERYVPAGITVAAVLGIWFASSLPVYMHLLPFQAHAPAAFSVALFLACWSRLEGDFRPRSWGLFGLAAGLMIETYLANTVFLAVPAIEFVRRWRTGTEGKVLSAGIVAFAAGTVAGLLPHWATRWILNGNPLDTGYRDEFFWSSPRLLDLAFSPEHGLFLWTPLLLAAVAGWILLWRRDRRMAGAMLASFAAFYYLIAAFQNWHGQSSFGSRFFVSFTGPFVVGLAVTLDRFAAWLRGDGRTGPRLGFRGATASIGALIGLLALWNAGFIFQWGVNMVPNRGPVDFVQVARNQITEVPRRATDFLARYFSAREDLWKDIERGDLEELPGYRIRR